MRKIYKLYLPFIIALSVVTGIIVGLRLNKGGSHEAIFEYPSHNKISALLDLIQREYVDAVYKDSITEELIPQFLEKLDPHSIYIPASQFQAVNEPMVGNFGGIGVEFNMLTDTISIVNTVKNGPSEKVGVIAGDKILYVNDSLVAGQNIPSGNIVKMLKGQIGTDVNIRVLRANEPDLLDFTITRGSIPIYSVDVSYMLNEDLGYLKIARFARTTFDEFVHHTRSLQERGMKKMIIDLRGNTGGYMDAAINIANQFLGKGKLIVYTEGRAKPRQDYYANASGICLATEVAILIDQGSASASEILAGAIQDNDRGLILGRRSFGKGLVQQETQFADQSVVRLTIARYHSPSGRCIQRPYENKEDYYSDIRERFVHGEMEDQDSIAHNDSLKYQTLQGRTVYGGGGISPDVFISIDTTRLNPYARKVLGLSLPYRFAFDYTQANREKLKALKTPEEFVTYLQKQGVLKQFVKYATTKDVKANWKQINQEKEILEIQITANICRNILNDEGFYPIIKAIDKDLLESIRYIEKEGLVL